MVEEHLKAQKKPSVSAVRKELRRLSGDFHSWAHFNGVYGDKRWPKVQTVMALIEGCQKPELKHFLKKKVSLDVDSMLKYVYRRYQL